VERRKQCLLERTLPACLRREVLRRETEKGGFEKGDFEKGD
jgi:hypothetical protein